MTEQDSGGWLEYRQTATEISLQFLTEYAARAVRLVSKLRAFDDQFAEEVPNEVIESNPERRAISDELQTAMDEVEKQMIGILAASDIHPDVAAQNIRTSRQLLRNLYLDCIAHEN